MVEEWFNYHQWLRPEGDHTPGKKVTKNEENCVCNRCELVRQKRPRKIKPRGPTPPREVKTKEGLTLRKFGGRPRVKIDLKNPKWWKWEDARPLPWRDQEAPRK